MLYFRRTDREKLIDVLALTLLVAERMPLLAFLRDVDFFAELFLRDAAIGGQV
jgi:hypothetical protein